MSRRTAVKVIPSVFGLFVAACSGTPPQPPRSPRELETPPPTPRKDPTQTPTEQEIEPGHLNAILETLKNTGDPFLGMISDHIKTIRSSPTIPAEFPDWIARDSTPAKIYVNSARESTADTNGKYGNKKSYLLRWANEAQATAIPAIELIKLDSIGLAIPDYVRAGGLIEEGMYLAKEWATHMITVRFASEFYDVMHGTLFNVSGLNGQPLTDPLQQELAGVTAFYSQADDRNKHNNDIWKVLDAYPAFLITTTLDELDRNGITNRQKNKLPSFRVANDRYLQANPVIRNIMTENSDSPRAPLRLCPWPLFFYKHSLTTILFFLVLDVSLNYRFIRSDGTNKISN